MKHFLFFMVVYISFFFLSNSAGAVCVKVPKANLRSGPGTKYEKTWHVFKYFPFKKTGKKGNWYEVEDVDGDVHWIYRKLVTNTFDCAVVKKDIANVRTGPGTRFETSYFGPAGKYDSFKVLMRQGNWVNVKDEFGNTGWIYRKLLWIY